MQHSQEGSRVVALLLAGVIQHIEAAERNLNDSARLSAPLRKAHALSLQALSSSDYEERL
jgi:hypothetical protein